VKELDAEIRSCHTQNEASQRLAEIPGIGPLTATALVASVGDAKTFHNGRQLAAWLGLVPRQNSTGGKTTLLGISKRGDSYLRMLLILGARSVLIKLKTHPERADGWLGKLAARRHVNIAAVALANKNARTAWALLARDRNYQADYRLAGAAV
jgi:transposase